MNTKLSLFAASLAVGLLSLAPQATAGDKHESKVRPAELTLDVIVTKHLTALGGADLLRATKTMSYVVSGEKAGKKFTKTARYARPGKMRVDIQSDDGAFVKAFDGKVAWTRKGTEAAVAMSAEDTASMKSHADFDEPLLDYQKRGDTVKLIGKADVKGTLAFDLELTKANGDVEHHFVDAKTFMPVQRTWKMTKDGKSTTMAVRFGDFKNVAGRMVNHSIEFDTDAGVAKSTVSQVTFDKPIDAQLFVLPKK